MIYFHSYMKSTITKFSYVRMGEVTRKTVIWFLYTINTIFIYI